MPSEARDYPVRIYVGHLGGGRRTWKPELFDAVEKAHTCEYVRADVADEMLDALASIANLEGSKAESVGLIRRARHVAKCAIQAAEELK